MNKNYKKLLKTLLLCSLALAQALVSSTLYAEPSESFKARMARFQNVENQAEQEKYSAPLKIAGRPNAAAIFREKQAIAELEKALQSMDFQAIKRIIDSNQGLVNLQQVEPLRVTVLKVCYNQNDRNKQLEILDYLLSVDGINVNLASNKPITQNALDVAIKNINALKSENLKAHYRIIAKKLIAQGAQLNELAQVEYAQEIVAQLSEVKPVVAEVQEPIVIPEISAEALSPAAEITAEERQRAEMSKKITRYTEELTQADDELRALRGKHSNQQDELNRINEKIAKKKSKITSLHQEREQLTNQLLEK